MLSRVVVFAFLAYFVAELVIGQKNMTAQEKEVLKMYGRNYHSAQRECVNDIIGNRSFLDNINPILFKIKFSVFYHNNSYKETKCYFGCVFKRLGVINNTNNVVVDDELRKFSNFLTNANANATEDIDDECADLEEKYKDFNYCDMGFQLYMCVDKVIQPKPKKNVKT
ncbi:hypothetical protein FQR65_LT18441 [Abscondita terminalis]|nr:hypothetical protein FQR65_LT18441 [Abscondita terminalis]